MTKTRTKSDSLEETKRIMERLVKMPHKPHQESKTGRRKPKAKKSGPDKDRS